jgi:hypothetical protein
MFGASGEAGMKTQAVTTKGPDRHGIPNRPKKFCNAGVVNRVQTMVTSTAYRKFCQVRGRKLASAIITRT